MRVRVRPLALQLGVHLPPAEALGIEGVDEVVIIEVIILFTIRSVEQPVDVAEAQPVEKRMVTGGSADILGRPGARSSMQDGYALP